MNATLANSPGGRNSRSLSLGACAAALAMVAAATFIGMLITSRWGDAGVVLLYIPPVLATAIYGGLWPALAAAIASTLAYNFYFTSPYRTFVIHSPADVVTVAILFAVALVTSRLAGSLRQQADLAAARAARNATIAGFARRLLASEDERDSAAIAVAELARLFDCNAVLVAGGADISIIAALPAGTTLEPSDLAAAALTLATGEPSGRGVRRVDLADWQFRPVSNANRVLAAAGLARSDGRPPVAEDQLELLSNLLDQLALALERARLEREARKNAGLHERDLLRSALLASIGEDVKPRLTAISTAARALKRGGSVDKSLVSIVTSEAARLDRYIDNLLDMNPGADQTPTVLGRLTIDRFRRAVSKNGADVHLTPKEYAVLAELARHAGRVLSHAQLLRAVWGPAHERQIDYLRVAVRSLRQKLEDDPAHPTLILNEPAVGYRLQAP